MAFNRNKTLAKAQKLLQKGKVADAIKAYQEIVDADPSDVRTLLKIGDLHAKLGNVDAGNDVYRKVAEHYAKDGFFLKAVAVFKQILRLDPGLISVYLRLAELYQQLGLNSEAMKQYQIVVRHYENKGLKKESLDVLKKMAELDPENTASRIKLAELYVKEGHKEAAAEQFQSITGELKTKQNFRDLTRVYEKMEDLGLGDDTIKVELSEIYLRTAEPKRALERLQVLFEADPKNHQVLELLARTFLDLQQPEKAKSVYKELISIFDEKGMTQERDRITAKLRTLGVTVDAKSEDAPTTEASPESEPSSGAGEEEASAPDHDKILGEVDVLIQYGLVEKACVVLKNAVLGNPSDKVIRQKLIEAYRAKQDEVGLVDVLNQSMRAAEEKGQASAVAAIQVELEGLSSPSTTEVTSTSSPEVGAVVTEKPGTESLDIDLAIDESIDLEIVDEEESAPQMAADSAGAEEEEISVDFSEDFERPEEEVSASLDVEPPVEASDSTSVESASPEPAAEASDADVGDDLDFGDTFDMSDEPKAPEVKAEEAPEIKTAETSAIEVEEKVEAAPSLEIPVIEEEEIVPEAVEEEPEIIAEEKAEAPSVVEEEEAPTLDDDFLGDIDIPDLAAEAPEPEVMEAVEAEQEKLPSVDEVEIEEEPAPEVLAEVEAVPEPEVVLEPEVEPEPVLASEPTIEPQSEAETIPRASVEVDDRFETDMEEAAFFVSQGLLEEAEEVYESILARDRAYQPAQERLAELKGVVEEAEKAPTTPRAKASKVEAEPPPSRSRSTERILKEAQAQSVSKSASEGEGLFDLSSELQDEILDLEGALNQEKPSDDEDFLSPEEVISEFKKGVARTVAKDDFQTHYNLGIAYKEMGLLDEAIHEFDHAAQDESLVIDCASMIGLCLMGKREFDTAIEVYRRALARTSPKAPEALGLSYELAEAYIGNGKIHEAFKLFARINDVDPAFRDVRRRVKELEADLGSNAPHPSAPEKPDAQEKVVEISNKKTKITYI